MEKSYILKSNEHPRLFDKIMKDYIRKNTDLRNVVFSPLNSSVSYIYQNDTNVQVKSLNSKIQIKFTGEEIAILEAAEDLESIVNIDLK